MSLGEMWWDHFHEILPGDDREDHRNAPCDRTEREIIHSCYRMCAAVYWDAEARTRIRAIAAEVLRGYFDG